MASLNSTSQENILDCENGVSTTPTHTYDKWITVVAVALLIGIFVGLLCYYWTNSSTDQDDNVGKELIIYFLHRFIKALV
ncbi:hypothetical protein Zmor_004863 [Zophobas morio]|uniref:Uncharacterized protein n=1 Tax=Zophobas morio TaxID=2755281 RepID=A0AA38MLD5_9CUCU|nr:hypothetical protein Zmor_004863 [Zophobas morio]